VDDAPLTRRGSLLKLGGGLVALLAPGLVRGGEAEAGTGPAGVASGAVSCVLAPEQTEGPYYVPGERVRRNITEGRPGTPLTLRLRVVDASTCRPVKGASVDVWHCDALGVYSGVQGNSGTFMRGVQRTDATGLALFTTVYPGWYQGRTVHIHVKVHLGGNVVHTGQLYFADPLTDAVYAKKPYSRRPGRTTRNADDAIYRNGGKRSTLALRQANGRWTGTITMGVHRA
jgi:protocatechuate 3,4-dioxygenase beta subunit